MYTGSRIVVCVVKGVLEVKKLCLGNVVVSVGSSVSRSVRKVEV